MAKAEIMIVEDEGITAHYIQNTLVNLGYTIISIENSGECTLEKLNNDKPDLVLMDIKLSGDIDGIETAEEIRVKFDIPVVFLTAHSDGPMIERAKIAQPYGYVLKPFDGKDLQSNIEMALYKHNSEKKMRELAYYDVLTGLPNRTLFYDRLVQALNISKRNNKMVAICMVDLDGFKCVNDRMGHDVGDKVLKEVAVRLKDSVRESDTVARIGGDEFILIVTNILNQADAATIAQKVLLSIGAPFELKSPICAIGSSIGISLCPDDGTDPDILIKKADMAMYHAKENGKHCFFFFKDINKKIALGTEVIVGFALEFVLHKKGSWNHNDWVNFLLSTERNGLHITENIKASLGLLLETQKKLYQLMPESDLNYICNEVVKFVKENKGSWLHTEWELLLQNFESNHIKLPTDKGHIVEEIVKNIKSLYIMAESNA
ncbi:MAG: diguanylate cyclase [Nitrospirae bacterium]|nr:diguanylate cyclase [Nitrospirota bacterium]MBF0534170.1 diguanylate cyclase [Nitrospirota bacterium]MBF0617057.1 diguanylate cyclase [Nitrospirota bacterium]